MMPLVLILKQFLKERSLHHAYTGGLSSYCLVLLLTAFLKHQLLHEEEGSADTVDPAAPRADSLGRLLLDFLHFYGRVFDPRRSGVAVGPEELFFARTRGGGGTIDLLHIADPMQQGREHNVGRNCFRMLQIQKAFADASRAMEDLVEACQVGTTTAGGAADDGGGGGGGSSDAGGGRGGERGGLTPAEEENAASGIAARRDPGNPAEEDGAEVEGAAAGMQQPAGARERQIAAPEATAVGSRGGEQASPPPAAAPAKKQQILEAIVRQAYW